ncbi:MAG: tyrosine-protein phosphatase [Actinomycetota bacterium]
MTVPKPPGPFEDVLNFREMGGLPAADGRRIRPGLLYRSGHWSQASEADVEALAGFDLASVVDFRTEIDRTGDGGPNRLPTGPEYLQLEMIDSSGRGHEIRSVLMSGDQELINARFGDGQAEAFASEGVIEMALDAEKQEVFARFLDVVADRDRRPVMFHCSAGKDRAGWAATLVGLALGVPDETLIEHYEASNIHRPVEQRLAHYAERGLDVSVLRPFLAVSGDYQRAGLAAIDERWPDRQAYLTDALGFGPDRVAALRADLLE